MRNTSNTQGGPLTGIRIIEMASLGPVPFAGMMLADLGAEVIRIDRTGDSDLGVPMDPKSDIMSRGRRSITLDLKNPEATEIVLKLVETADALMEGMRPRVMDRRGLGPDDCLACNPKLIYGRMTGWGQTGPMAPRAGHDINYISLNGVLHSIGSQGGPPVPPINLVGDFGGGSMFLITGMLAALLEARTSGKGQVIDAAMVDGSSYLMTMVHMFSAAGLWRNDRGSNLLDGGAPFYRVYETNDGKHMAVGAIEARFYREFVAGLGFDIDALPNQMDPREWDTLRNTFAQAFKTRTRDEWTDVFLNQDACVTPVLSIEESTALEHNQRRDSFPEFAGKIRPGAAPRFSRTETDASRPNTQAGEHGREILRDLAFSEQQIDQLISRKLVVVPAE